MAWATNSDGIITIVIRTASIRFNPLIVCKDNHTSNIDLRCSYADASLHTFTIAVPTLPIIPTHRRRLFILLDS